MKRLLVAITVLLLAFVTSASAEVYLGRMADYDMENACGIFSVINCINSLELSQVKLDDAVKSAKAIGWTSKGMTFQQAEMLAKEIAPETVKVRKEYLTIDSIQEIVRSGGCCTIAIDSSAFWKAKAYQKDDHLIAIVGVNEKSSEFDIIDSGLGYESMSIEQLESCTADIICGIAFLPTEC